MPVHTRGTPVWTSTAKPNIASTSSATAHGRVGSTARP